MASEEAVSPLRVSKNGAKAGSKMQNSTPRPLSEISATEKRRNSPSWNQGTKKMIVTTDSSPFQSSPLDVQNSPRMFWENRFNAEKRASSARSGSPSPTRRPSVERLQKASRVKNSNILALEQKKEYDPTRLPCVERPLAKVQANAYGGTGSISPSRLEHRGFGHRRTESKTQLPLCSPSKPKLAPLATAPSAAVSQPPSPSKEPGSPIKSSLSHRFKSSFDPETGTWSADTSTEEPELQRQAKCVTFDAAPPQVNEYEMATPDISTIGSDSREGSFEESIEDEEDDSDAYLMHGGGDHDDSFDASLEDTDKTPVVGPDDPDDWHHDGQHDQHERSPLPEDMPVMQRPQHDRTDSSNSSGDHRPLPPLPGGPPLARSHSTSSNGLSATAERMLGQHRSLPSPPPASTTKAEMQNIGNAKMTLEERLRLMMLSDDGKSAAEQQRERRMRRAAAKDRNGSQTPEMQSPEVQSPHSPREGDEYEGDTVGDVSGLDMDYQLPRKISRESILRRVHGKKPLDGGLDYNFSSPLPSPSPEQPQVYDPDIPLPSTEFDDDDDDDAGSVLVKREVQDVDIFDLPPLSQRTRSESREQTEDTESVYSDYNSVRAKDHDEDEGTSTPRPTTPAREPQEDAKMTDMHPFLRPHTPEHMVRRSLSKPEYDGSGWGDPEDEFDEPGTPESVIHRPVVDYDDEEVPDSPAIPERMATIKAASGSKLKTRPSATPADLMAMREARRQASQEMTPTPSGPARQASGDTEVEVPLSPDSEEFLERHPSFKNRSLTLELDLGLSLDQDFQRVIEAQKVDSHQFTSSTTPHPHPVRPPIEDITSAAATKTEDTDKKSGKQRGYLMRQNTKLVAASDKADVDERGYRSAGNSPVKQTRPQSWTVEPWNSQARKRSIKKRAAGPGAGGPVPPLPGRESNAAAAQNPLAEDDVAAELATEESGERGRLFVKVMGVKDLDLPLPKNERTWFSLTLDNGVHCVTTAWLELARNAPIGQEFELVVPNDLEFQLTLNVKLEKPASQPSRIPTSPSKSSRPKGSAFSRVFASPKKRKEMELRQREEDERAARQQREAAAARQQKLMTPPTAWDLLSPLAAEDGSFARAYVCLKDHENRCFGRPYVVEAAAFNEWATEEANFASSVKSKRTNASGAGGVVRRAPYKIGKLELQLLFVPRPKGSTDDDMPKSMNSCIREMKAAEERLARNYEGHLSQQGGDCPYWRRRYFKLVGTKLTAYHEATRQPRATINLANAKRLIDDRRTLTEKETTGKGGRRRRSAFAEDEEGYMFVEEGFRIRFNNGELIDFYADSTQDKDGWMKVLGDIIGRDSLGSDDGGDGASSSSRAKGKWCELVLKREETLRRRAGAKRVHSRTKSAYT